MATTNRKNGFIKIIALIILGVLILSAMNIDIRKKVPRDKIMLVWTEYIKRPAGHVINYVESWFSGN